MNTNMPPNNMNLRAFISLFNLAKKHKDTKALSSAYELIEAGNMHNESLMHDVRVLAFGTKERIDRPDAEAYYAYTDDEMREATLGIERCAYGDFKETLHVLECAMREIDGPTLQPNTLEKLDYIRVDLFSEEQQEEWRKFYNRAQKCAKEFAAGDDYEVAHKVADLLINELRVYQQQFYGPLVPVMVATYLHTAADGSRRGVSVRATWHDEALCITTSAPFAPRLDIYWTQEKPVESRRQFNPTIFPTEIGGYSLGDIESINLFAYEL